MQTKQGVATVQVWVCRVWSSRADSPAVVGLEANKLRAVHARITESCWRFSDDYERQFWRRIDSGTLCAHVCKCVRCMTVWCPQITSDMGLAQLDTVSTDIVRISSNSGNVKAMSA